MLGAASRKGFAVTVETSLSGFTVTDLCIRWKVGPDKVRAFLRRGELVGVTLAMDLSARPQWRVTQDSVELFERRRSSKPLSKQPRRRGRRTLEVDYYPD